MRKLLWAILLFGAYIWAMTSGNDQIIIEKGKSLYQSLVAWFDDAEVDFQVKPSKLKSKLKSKKKTRRWD